HAAARRPDLVLLDVALDRGRMGPRRDPVDGGVVRRARTRTGDVRARARADREEGRVAGEEVEEDDDVTDSDAAVVVNVAALAGTAGRTTVGAGDAVLRLQQEQGVGDRDPAVVVEVAAI